jgi:DNA-directed RNA polymerase specialized sigma24 family protein
MRFKLAKGSSMGNESNSRPLTPGRDVASGEPAQPSDNSGEATDLTLMLRRLQSGEPGAADALAEMVYKDLLAMARAHLSRDVGPDVAGVTIQPTILANDTLMNLIRQRQQFDNTGHFFAIASRLMTRVLLDYHRMRKAQKRAEQSFESRLSLAATTSRSTNALNPMRM